MFPRWRVGTWGRCSSTVWPTNSPTSIPEETAEWLAAFDDVVRVHGRNRARYLLMRVLEQARRSQVDFPPAVSTPYVNSIPSDAEPEFPGDEDLERRIRAFIRWNAAVMVVRANIRSEAIGGHLATYASSAALYEVGFNHFFRGKDGGGPGDQVYIQGHASPGIYARAFVEGRLSESQLDSFRFEVGGGGLSSYPHPRLMPDFWEYPTVSMGLGPINAIAQAHLARYLAARGLADTSASRVWAFVGDGEFDEPETAGAARHGRPRAPRQPHHGRQLQPPAARRTGARQRQGDPGVRGHPARRRLERHQGDLGPDVGRTARPGRRRRAAGQDERDGRRRVPEVRHRVGGLHPRALLRARPTADRPGRAPERRRAPEPAPGRPRLPQALRRLPGGHRARRCADGHPGQDRQGLDPRPRDRGPQRHPPDQEDDQGPAPRPARPAVPPRGDRRVGPRRRRPPVLPARPRLPRRQVPGGAPAAARRPPPVPGGAGPAAALPEPADASPTCSAARGGRRSRPPWPSPDCSGP